MNVRSLAALGVVAALGIGCSFEHKSTNLLEPTPVPPSGGANPPVSTPSIVGTWTSRSTSTQSADTCSNFRFQIASQTATTVSGSLTATCNGLAVSGNATGQLNGPAIAVSFSGNGTMPAIPRCDVTLAANATIEDGGNTIRIPYSGQTCLGPVSGVELLQR